MKALDNLAVRNMVPKSDNESSKALNIAIYRILKALAKLSIQLSMSAATMSELLRRAYVDAAEETINERGQKLLTTDVCAMTGLYRKEVMRLRNLPALSDGQLYEKQNRSTQVITGWLRDKDFHTAGGRPAALPQTGKNSFTELVKRYSGDMAPTAMRLELERLRVVSVNSRGQIKLLTSGYIAAFPPGGIHILGIDTTDLINTIQFNIATKKPDRRFQRKVNYVNLPQKHVEPFRIYAASESQKLLEKLDRWLDKRDDNEKQNEKTPGARVGVGVYHFECSSPDKKQNLLKNSD